MDIDGSVWQFHWKRTDGAYHSTLRLSLRGLKRSLDPECFRVTQTPFWGSVTVASARGGSFRVYKALSTASCVKTATSRHWLPRYLAGANILMFYRTALWLRNQHAKHHKYQTDRLIAVQVFRDFSVLKTDVVGTTLLSTGTDTMDK